jgi:hypothetical protein
MALVTSLTRRIRERQHMPFKVEKGHGLEWIYWLNITASTAESIPNAVLQQTAYYVVASGSIQLSIHDLCFIRTSLSEQPAGQWGQ